VKLADHQSGLNEWGLGSFMDQIKNVHLGVRDVGKNDEQRFLEPHVRIEGLQSLELFNVSEHDALYASCVGPNIWVKGLIKQILVQ
jgi:hypothetical protein